MEERIEELFELVKDGTLYPYEAVDKLLRLFIVSVSSEVKDDEFAKCAEEVERKYQMGGLTGGLYEKFARDTFREFMDRLNWYS
jgi:hypothetical protein